MTKLSASHNNILFVINIDGGLVISKRTEVTRHCSFVAGVVLREGSSRYSMNYLLPGGTCYRFHIIALAAAA